jgi:hypothetical protein
MIFLIALIGIPICILMFLYIKQYLKNRQILNKIEFRMTTDEFDNMNISIDHEFQIYLNKKSFKKLMLKKEINIEIIENTWNYLKKVILALNLWNTNIDREIFECFFRYSQDQNFKFSQNEISKFVSKIIYKQKKEISC